MWKTLTAKSKWLPGAYRLLQGEKVRSAHVCCAHLFVGVRACVRVCVCVLVCVCEGENVNLYMCCKFSLVTAASDSSHFSIQSK